MGRGLLRGISSRSFAGRNLPAPRSAAQRQRLYLAEGTRELFRPIRARAEEQADKLAKEILELSDKIEDDNPVKVQRARLQVDSRKWLAARLAPKKYGDQVQHEHKGGVNFQ